MTHGHSFSEVKRYTLRQAKQFMDLLLERDKDEFKKLVMAVRMGQAADTKELLKALDRLDEHGG